jgi:hypothetical protein
MAHFGLHIQGSDPRGRGEHSLETRRAIRQAAGGLCGVHSGAAASGPARAITERLGRAAGNAHKVLESLFDRPIVSVNDVRKITGTTYAAANSLVLRLVEVGVLSEMTGYARNRRFRYAPYIALFNEGPSVPA